MAKPITLAVALGVSLAAVSIMAVGVAKPSRPVSDAEWALIRPLALDRLPPPPADPSNRVSEDPKAAAFGKALFFDPRLSANGKVSCATCHLPEKDFQDSLTVARGVGITDRRTMPVAGTVHSPWLFWDGRKDSLWSQALGPLESAVEHGGDRTRYAHLVAEKHRGEYEAVFGSLPDLRHLPRVAGPVADAEASANWDEMSAEDREAVNTVFANIGKAIAAYERRIAYLPSRFDRWVTAVENGDAAAAELLNDDEIEGLKLFVGKAQCVNCHNGPLFTDNHFHNTGVPPAAGKPADPGRAPAVAAVRSDLFNCLGPYSDAEPEQCGELRFMNTDTHDMEGAFKAPSLRGVDRRAPYMHAGQIASLSEVIDHYNRAPASVQGHTQLQPLGLTSAEMHALQAFLETLDGAITADAKERMATTVPSSARRDPSAQTRSLPE